ncbi:MAG: Stp1/IreP family PP2C-type Ser/Thr phosphatase [Proteocatella sp.]
MEYYLKSHVGKVRSNNEDFIGHFPLCDTVHIFVVSDGMGGHNKGEIASRIATTTVISAMENQKSQIENFLKNGEMQKNMNLLVNSIKMANQAVYEESEKEDFFGMGTTMGTALIADERLMVANVGDSRCYLMRNKKINQLTKDNSFVQELVESGIITSEEATTHSQKNVITRAIGTDCDIKVDTYEFELEDEDIVMLCSDGLTNMIKDEELLKILSSTVTLEEKANILIDRALENGGLDNISLICIKYENEVGAENDK